MEKYGICVAPEEFDMKKTGEKRVRDKNEFICEHPTEALVAEGDMKFCSKCGNYLGVSHE